MGGGILCVQWVLGLGLDTLFHEQCGYPQGDMVSLLFFGTPLAITSTLVQFAVQCILIRCLNQVSDFINC